MKTGGPDPKPALRRKPRGGRTLRSQVTDPSATTRAVLEERECLACGAPAATGHHIVPKGAPYFGDDVVDNVVALCGDGASRCHGAVEGNPYSVPIGPFGLIPMGRERRDGEWARRRIGLALLAPHRRPKVDYVLTHLGEVAGRDLLRRRYYVEVP